MSGWWSMRWVGWGREGNDERNAVTFPPVATNSYAASDSADSAGLRSSFRASIASVGH
jgi:hypothetical protein